MGWFAGLISLIGFGPYIFSTLQGKTRPNRATWTIWTIVGTVIVTSYYASGATHTLWVPLCIAIGHFAIAILALFKGQGGWTGFDRSCLLGAGVSLLLWWRLQSPLIALLINILIDFLGALPTLKKAYQTPQTESLVSWVIFLTANTLNLFALDQWTLALATYPLYLFGLTGSIVILLLRPVCLRFL